MRALALLVALALPAAEPPLARLKSEAVAYAETQAPQGEGSYRFRLVAEPTLPPSRGTNLRFEPSHLSKREPTGRFFVSFRVFEGTRLLGSARVDLEGTWQGRLLQTRTSLPRKALLDGESVEEVPFEGTPPAGALTAIPEGRRLRNPVGAGKILTQADLEPIPLVVAGDRVRLEVVIPGLCIATEAIARSPGALGDSIRLELPSKKQLQASVTGKGEARLSSGGTR